MHHVFGSFLDDFVLVYLDDILVYSPTAAAHEQHLRAVFDKLREHRLFAKRSKCDFGVRSVEYLGHVVGAGKLRADPAKLATVQGWPVPTCLKHV